MSSKHALALVIGLSLASAANAEEYRQHDAHVHGHVEFNIAQDGKGYASGTQLGEGSFFGRRAGMHAAHH